MILALLVTAGLLLNGARLRARVRALPMLEAVSVPSDRYQVIVAAGVELTPRVRQQAAAHAHQHGLGLLDLVPAVPQYDTVLDFLRRVDPGRYRDDRLGQGLSAGAALLVATQTADRAQGLPEGAVDAGTLADLAARVRPYTQADADVVVVPGLRSPVPALSERRLYLTEGRAPVPLAVGLPVLSYLLVAVAVGLDRGWWGLLAVVAYCAQPFLVFAGTPVRPAGLLAAGLLRVVREPYVWVATVRGPVRAERRAEAEAARVASRAVYAQLLADGAEGFCQPRRPDCPACGGTALTVEVRSPDLIQGKPGRFTLERCRECRHVFQNPAVTPEGLDFYYRDFYDGYGASLLNQAFGASVASYRGRAAMLAPFTTPKNWLDVGTGHGHFCSYAQDAWPGTVFDGLDQGAEVEVAARRGWIQTGYRGSFLAVGPSLVGRYDVVSMHHYLEHTRDPWQELDIAADLLPPGGYLLIELPDPDWWLRVVLRRFWVPWLQPQHLHLMPIGNLDAAVRARGLTPVATDRAKAHQASDLMTAVLLAANTLAPDQHAPWRLEPVRWARTRRLVIWSVAAPVLPVALGLDLLLGAVWGWLPAATGNTYRLLARKDAPAG